MGGRGQGGVGGNDSGCVKDEADGDYLEKMLWNIGPEVLLKSMKGHQNLEMVKRIARETLYGIEKVYSTCWMVLRFVLELCRNRDA